MTLDRHDDDNRSHSSNGEASAEERLARRMRQQAVQAERHAHRENALRNALAKIGFGRKGGR